MTDTTAAIREKDLRHHIHPWGDHNAMRSQGATVLVRGEGAYVWDSEGHKLIDGVAGLWCVNIGHGRAEMAEAIAEQVRTLTYYSTFGSQTNPVAAELAERLCRLTPKGLNHVFFSSSGSDANETAIRTVLRYFTLIGKPKKRHVLTLEDAYHGSTYLTASMSGPAFYPGWARETGFIHRVAKPYPYRRPEGVGAAQYLDHLATNLEETIERLGADEVACFIAEPIMGRGVVLPPEGYHRRMQEVCRRHGVLYISDEVVTGFGRLGHIYASEPRFGLTPDILTSAKGISSGYVPLAATFVSDEIYDVLSAPGEVYYHGFTYTGHPVACAAALKNLEIIERERILETVRTRGARFQRMLEGLTDLAIVGEGRGSYYMMGIEFVMNQNSRERFPESVKLSERIARRAYGKGLVARAIMPEVILLSPTLVLSDGDLADIERILRESIRETMDELVREKLWRPTG
ncbi:MAG: aminotransferase class III-fold pyridoxal phosphate-dependent enzyme [Alphaproteobacteria bacterium]